MRPINRYTPSKKAPKSEFVRSPSGTGTDLSREKRRKQSPPGTPRTPNFPQASRFDVALLPPVYPWSGCAKREGCQCSRVSKRDRMLEVVDVVLCVRFFLCFWPCMVSVLVWAAVVVTAFSSRR